MNLLTKLWKCFTDPTFGEVVPPPVVIATPPPLYYGWISADNYMPDTSHDQILVFNGRYPRCGKVLGTRDGGKAFHSPHDEKLSGITYWAHIPPLPLPQSDPII